MSIRIPSEKLFVKVWSTEAKDSCVRGRGTTSDKNKDGTYNNSSWDLVFCGKCKDAALELKEKDLVVVTAGKITHESYEDKKTKERKFPNPCIVIFDYEIFNKEQKMAPQNTNNNTEMPY